jgi:hypothetical protein
VWYNIDIEKEIHNMSSIHNDAVIEQIAEALAEEFNRDPTEVEVETEVEKLDYYHTKCSCKETEFKVGK